MKHVIFLLWFFLSVSLLAQPRVELVTRLGTILVEVDTLHAPRTAKHFLNLVKTGCFTHSKFYRVVRMDNQPDNTIKIEVIQGGLKEDSLIEMYQPICHETTLQTGLKHLNGVIAMARNEPGTASTEFFICIGDQPELDFGGKRNPDGQGFAAFGRVIDGMSVVREIQRQKDIGQYLVEPILIIRMELL